MNVRVQAVIAGLLAVCQLPAVFLALGLGENPIPLLQSMLICAGVALLYPLTRGAPGQLTAKDGILGVAIGWALTVQLGGLPYIFAGELGWIDATFETASGFTTTGSSVLTDIEVWPQSLLLWRSTTHYIGGMGILLLAIAILPFLGVGGLQLMKAEVPGPTKDKLVPRVASTAQILWGLYFAITLACIAAYYFSGMTLLDAVNHAFATLATGGFSTRNASMGAFSPAAQWWSTFFMMAAGANFMLHYRLLMKRDGSIWEDDELRWYLAIFFAVGLFSAWVAYPVTAGQDVELALRQGLFHVASIMTTTGFAATDWEKWPMYAQLVMLAIMIPGAMAGSTAGGIKIVRAVIMARIFSASVNRLLIPERVVLVKINRKPLSPEVIEGTVAMVSAAAAAVVISTIFLVAWGMDVASAYSAALTAFCNVGPGIGSVGPMDNFSAVPDLGKLLLAFLMVLGRLEIFTLIILFLPRFWRE
ncbi:MAG: TrkH family potassium uptake protein [Magnetococcales bacterium]|nr:TrkH family potassium uptake protein [Magnetococcales bacterium]